MASHRLIGWIYRDPGAIERYAALGVPGGAGYYIVSRAPHLAPAGADVVAAAYFSILPEFVAGSMALCEQHTTYPQSVPVDRGTDRPHPDGPSRRHRPPGLDAGWTRPPTVIGW